MNLTKANDVKENTNTRAAEAAILGHIKGNQNLLNRRIFVFPDGNNLHASSYDESIVERRGSQNLITRAKLNQA